MKKTILFAIVMVLAIGLTATWAGQRIALNEKAMANANKAERETINHGQHQGIVNPSLITSTYLNEDFEGTFLPTDWTQIITNASYTWYQYTSNGYSGTNSARCPYNYSQDEELITPALDFTGATSDLRLTFAWMGDYTWMVDPYDNGNYEVWISLDGGTTWSTLLWAEDSIGLFDSYVWQTTNIDLSAYVGETNVKFAFKYIADDANAVYLDLVVVTDDPLVLPPNDECTAVTPVALTAGVPLLFTGDNTNATNDCGLLSSPQVWEAFTTTTDLTITIDYCGTTPVFGDAYGVLALGCPCGELYSYTTVDTCLDGNYTITFVGIPAGTYYYPVLMSLAYNAVGPYTINVNAVPYTAPPVDYAITLPAALPYDDLGKTTCGMTDDFAATCLGSYDSGPDAVYQITLTTPYCLEFVLDADSSYGGIALDDQYPINRNTCLATATNSSIGQSIITGQELAAGTYYLMVDNWAPGPSCIDYDLHIRSCTPPPANDSCQNAQVVGNVLNLPWSTAFATPDSNAYIYSNAIWYSYTATSTATVLVSLCGSSFDTRLQVFEGTSCDPLGLLVAQDDDSCDPGLQSFAHFSPISGQTYLIQVGGYSTNSGDGVLTIEAGDPVFNVTPSAVTGTAPLNGSDTDTLTVTNTGTATLTYTAIGTQDPFLRRAYDIRRQSLLDINKSGASQLASSLTNKTNNMAKRAPAGTRHPNSVSPSMLLTNYLTEDFEGTVPPTGWTAETTIAAYTWTQAAVDPFSGAFNAHCLYDDTLRAQHERLITPTINLSTATTDVRVQFAWSTSYNWFVSPNNNGNYELWISIDGGATWSDLLWAEDSVGVFADWEWYEASINLGAYIGQSNVKLSWLYEGTDAAETNLDLVVITDDPPCQVTCPPGALNETELCGDSLNNGISGTAVDEILVGQTFCGTVWADTGYRDLDFYLFEADHSVTITATGAASCPYRLWITDAAGLVLATLDAAPCSTLTISATVPSGTYYIVAAANVFYNVFCDGSGIYPNNYYFSVATSPVWLSLSTSGTILPGGDPAKIPVYMDGNGLAVGTYTGNIRFETNDPLNATYDIPVTFTITGGGTCDYLIGDMSGDNVRGGGDVTYFVRYLKGVGLCPPDSCANDSVSTTRGHWLYVAADVNGDCNHSGGDVTRLVAYFKGNAHLSCCRFFPTTVPPLLKQNNVMVPGKTE